MIMIVMFIAEINDKYLSLFPDNKLQRLVLNVSLVEKGTGNEGTLLQYHVTRVTYDTLAIKYDIFKNIMDSYNLNAFT